MAVKDHSLDDKIIQAAKHEFLEHGFQKASLHKIADRAGITTGALYTRYKNKDDLFCSLMDNFKAGIETSAMPMYEKYREVQRKKDVDLFIKVMNEEVRIYLDTMFEHYDECVLFFCKSAGSSLEMSLKEMMDMKAHTTVQFLQEIAGKEIDKDGVEIIMGEQFHIYKLILEKGYTKERALSCMEMVQNFLEAGWKDLFQRIL